MQAHPTGRTVVVGVDGSDSALDAVRWAAREADRRRLPLRVVHAFGWPTPDTSAIPGSGSTTGRCCNARPARCWRRPPRRPGRRCPVSPWTRR